MMRAVAHMEPQPLWQREIAERGMLHEQIVPASRQELVCQRDEARHAVPQLPLHRARIGTLGRLRGRRGTRSEEHTSELQSPCNLVCRLLLEKKKKHEQRLTKVL